MGTDLLNVDQDGQEETQAPQSMPVTVERSGGMQTDGQQEKEPKPHSKQQIQIQPHPGPIPQLLQYNPAMNQEQTAPPPNMPYVATSWMHTSENGPGNPHLPSQGQSVQNGYGKTLFSYSTCNSCSDE